MYILELPKKKTKRIMWWCDVHCGGQGKDNDIVCLFIPTCRFLHFCSLSSQALYKNKKNKNKNKNKRKRIGTRAWKWNECESKLEHPSEARAEVLENLLKGKQLINSYSSPVLLCTRKHLCSWTRCHDFHEWDEWNLYWRNWVLSGAHTQIEVEGFCSSNDVSSNVCSQT